MVQNSVHLDNDTKPWAIIPELWMIGMIMDVSSSDFNLKDMSVLLSGKIATHYSFLVQLCLMKLHLVSAAVTEAVGS